MKAAILAIAVSLTLTLPAWAQDTNGQSALQVAKQTAEHITHEINQNREKYRKNPEALYSLVNKVVLPHFEFRYMSRIVLGRYWRQATPGQRKRFTQAFKSLLVHTYANSLLKYSDHKIIWKPVHAKDNAQRVTIRSEVELEHGSPVPINYRAVLENGQWKVYDVAVDGVSLVTNYRSSFAIQARRNGIDKLIERIQKKSEQKAGNHAS